MSKPHCYGEMKWILKYPKDEIPKSSICNCCYKNKCLELTLNTEKEREVQQFQLGDTVYMIDEDYRLFESEVYKIELADDVYYYTTNDCDFEDGDIGKWVFKSKMERESRLAALI